MDPALVQWLMVDEFGLEDTASEVPAWYAAAACAGHDTALWFPEKGDDWRPAIRVCEACPVRQECLQHALDHDERVGVWGGLTAGQRARVARQAA